jgi:hypothetical protein
MAAVMPSQSQESIMKAILIGVLVFSLTGCNANWNSIFRTHDFNVDSGEGRHDSAFIDINQRAILSGNHTVCAEPSPDAMQAYAAELAASGNLNEKAKGELAAAVQTSAAYVGMRSKNIQLFRDEFFRLCEALMNDTIDGAQYTALFARLQRYSVALAAIEELNQGAFVTAAYLSSAGNASIASNAAKQQELSEITTQLEAAKKTAKDAPSDAANAKVNELTKKEKSLKTEIEEGKVKTVGGSSGGLVGSGTSATGALTADATERMLSAALNYDDTPNLCLGILYEYAKKSMGKVDTWSELPDGRVVSRAVRPLNEADKLVVNYCEGILKR